MSSTTTFVSSTFSFDAPYLAKYAPSEDQGDQWNLLFSNKGNRKISAESCDTVTTADESIVDSNSKDSHKSFSPGSQSPRNSWNFKGTFDSEESQEENGVILNSTMKPKKKTVTDDTKYKTELCKKFSETGHCPYGRKCKFAHGKHELNEKLLANKRRYKSKLCNSFHSNMTCPYGSRCLFAHENRTVQELQQPVCVYEKLVSYPDLLNNSFTNRRQRLPAFAGAIENTIAEELEEEFNHIIKLSSQ